MKKRKERQRENLNTEINFTAGEEAHEEGSSHHSRSAVLPQAAPPPALPHFKSALPSCCQPWEHGHRTEPSCLDLGTYSQCGIQAACWLSSTVSFFRIKALCRFCSGLLKWFLLPFLLQLFFLGPVSGFPEVHLSPLFLTAAQSAKQPFSGKAGQGSALLPDMPTQNPGIQFLRTGSVFPFIQVSVLEPPWQALLN